MKADVLRFSLLGYGHIGKRHAEAIKNLDGIDLVSVCDTDPSQTSGLDKSGVAVFNNVDSMLSDGPASEVLSVATPNGLHAVHALKGLESGRHVIIEKPMALKAEDCRRIIEVSDALKLKVFCVMQNRYSPPAAWLKDVLNKNILGNVYMVQINCFWNRDERYYTGKTWRGSLDLDGGTLFTQFSHFIDVLLWLFGDVSDIHPVFADFKHKNLTEFEDSGTIQFKLGNGGLGNFNYSSAVWDKNFESSLTLIAENGTVRIGGQYMNELSYCHIKEYKKPELAPSEPANNYGLYTGSASNHTLIYKNVLAALKTDAPIDNTATEGLKVVELIEQIYQNNTFKKKIHS
jgi:predicted dehydrogenase